MENNPNSLVLTSDLLIPLWLSAEIHQLKMSEQMEEKIKAYKTAPFDARFPNTNQTRNCFQNYLGEPVWRHPNVASAWHPQPFGDLIWHLPSITCRFPSMYQSSVSQRPGHSPLRLVPESLPEPLSHQLGEFPQTDLGCSEAPLGIYLYTKECAEAASLQLFTLRF